MKYIVDLPKNARWIEIYHEVNYLTYEGNTVLIEKLEPYTEPDFKSVEDEVWELADYMCRMSQTEKSQCFGFSYPSEVTTNLTYQEAKDKFEAWMKQNDEIKIGDEVEYECCGEVVKFIVTGINDSLFYGFKSPCEYYDVGEYAHIDSLRKTGRHFPEVVQLLEKMKGENYETT